MNLQRREEIRAIAKEFRRLFLHEQAEAIDELLAHIATLEQAAAERVIRDGSRGPTPDYTGEGSAWVPPAVAPAAVVPENLLHDLAVAAWDEGADAGMVWDPDADPAKRGVVPCTPGEGIAKARDHFAKHGSGSPSSAFSRALQAIREHSRTVPADRALGDGMDLEEAENLRDTVRFLAFVVSRASQIRHQIIFSLRENKPDEAKDFAMMKWPIIQGMQNQIDLEAVGNQAYQAKRIRPAIDSLLALRANAKGAQRDRAGALLVKLAGVAK